MSKEFLSQPPGLLSELMQQIDGNGGNLRTWPVDSGADSEELSWCRYDGHDVSRMLELFLANSRAPLFSAQGAETMVWIS